MCGITGALQLRHGPPVDPGALAAMTDVLAHRGPDDRGVWLDDARRVGLGSRRLAIIDLSPAGHMPMLSPDGQTALTFNGEIYNHADYRTEIEASGVTFRGRSDTEVILHLYRLYGREFVHKLRGMFAIALWDAAEQRLLLIRDRIGVKPLYWTIAGGQFLFSSEIKSLLLNPAVARAVDPEAFYHFMTFLTTPAPQTLFKGIYKLPPGTMLAVGVDGDVQITRYWDVFDDAQPHPEWTAADWIDALRAELRDSIRLRMVSDVPFGVFLSGGIDSSTNTALMAEQLDHPVETFSIGYHDAPDYNEFDWARQVAGQFGANHHEVQIGPQDLLDFLPKLIYHQDEPIADPVCVPLYYVSKLARDHGTIVVQVGEGADELFVGYDHWRALLQLHGGAWQTFTGLPGGLRQLGYGLSAPFLSPVRRELVRRGAAGEQLFWSGAEAFGESAKAGLLTADFRRQVNGLTSHAVIAPLYRQFVQRSPAPDYANWMAYTDLHLRLPELLLMRVDKMSMATSIEARVPFLDHRFVGLAMSIPQALKVDGAAVRPKHLFKQAVRGIIPDAIIDRPKQGFRVPVKDWLADTLGTVTRTKLRDFCQRVGYFEWPVVEKLIDSHDELAWYLLNFVLWHELWIEGQAFDLPAHA